MNKSFFKLIVFGTTIFFFHTIVNYLLPILAIDLKDVIKIHGFMFLITLIVIKITNRITDKFPDRTGFVYLGFVLFKMTTSVIFLFPYFSLELFHAKTIVSNFFVIFFIYIVFEAISVINYLNLKQKN